jgi:dTDP-4-dehydrorhamnose reductase
MKKLVWITGNYGQIGKVLTKMMQKKHEVTFADNMHGLYLSLYNRTQTNIAHMYEYDPEYIPEIDVRDTRNIDQIVRYMVLEAPSYDAIEIWHAAAHVGADKCAIDTNTTYDVNVSSVLHLIKAMNMYGFLNCKNAAFINFTSTSLLRPTIHKQYQLAGVDDQMLGLTGLFDGDTPREPQAWYGHTKLMGERLVKAAFQGHRRVFNVAPVMGCGRNPDDNASDMRKYATLAFKFATGQLDSVTRPMVCCQNFNFWKAYVDVEVVLKHMIDYVDETVADSIKPAGDVHEAVFAGTMVERFGNTLEMIFREMYSALDCKHALQHHLLAVKNPKLFVNKPERDYLGCHLPYVNWIMHLADLNLSGQHKEKRVTYTKAAMNSMFKNVLSWQPKLIEIHAEEPSHEELVKSLVQSFVKENKTCI